MEKINSSIDKMNEYQDLISKKVVEMNSFSKKLQENKKVLKDLVDMQNRKDAILKSVREKLVQRRKST